MNTLSIEDFSCLKSVRFSVAPVTILIGPQGSGKSVTTKLNYFFSDILINQYFSAEKDVALPEFKSEVARQFQLWFPPSAWGNGRFNITFNAGPFTARILRRMSKGSVTDSVSVTFSEFFNDQYNKLRAAYKNLRADDVVDDARLLRRSIEGGFRIRESSEAHLASELGQAFTSFQTFIPAGRAFFTSMGRLVAAMEQGSSLDPVTIRFAKLFANLRDRGPRFPRLKSDHSPDAQLRRTVMKKLFGGEMKFEKDLEFVETSDGRRIPFSALSSGQQELLPMWLFVDYFASRPLDREKGCDLFYIEEPEAHLFPEAQSLLMDFLIGAILSRRENRALVLTTHSPYILSKINNYLKAGLIGADKNVASAVGAIVPKERWLTPDRVRAYAIVDGTLSDLMSEDGLIDARYIDAVSDEVSKVFTELLDIEYADTSDD